MTTPPPTRPVYRTAVVEQPVAAPRVHVWSVLVDLLDKDAVGPAAAGWSEQVVSFEPPWRRVGRLELAPDTNAEHTVTIRDDDASSCLLIWSALIDVTADPEAARVERIVDRLAAAMRDWAHRVDAAAATVG